MQINSDNTQSFNRFVSISYNYLRTNKFFYFHMYVWKCSSQYDTSIIVFLCLFTSKDGRRKEQQTYTDGFVYGKI